MLSIKKLAAILPLVMALGLHGYAQTDAISIIIVSPGTNQQPGYTPQIVGDQASIVVAVSASYRLDSVIATVGGRSVSLTWSTNGWYGSLSLVGLPQDTTTLTVRAVDAYNNSATASGEFIYDSPPTLTIDSPTNYTVAAPDLHTRVHCHSDSGACAINVQIVSGGLLGTYSDSCDVNYDLSAYEGQSGSGTNSLQLAVWATDRRGITTNAPLNVLFYVENSPYLTPVVTADYRISDVSGTRVFVEHNDSAVSLPHIIDFSNGSTTYIPFTLGVAYNSSHLTSTGAVFFAGSANPASGGSVKLVEWHNGSLDTLYRLNNGQFYPGYMAAGDYATFPGNAYLYPTNVRNLATQTNQSLGVNTGAVLSPSGTMALYSTAGTHPKEVLWNLFNSNTGSSTVLVDDNTGTSYGGGVTDGTHILYLRAPGSGGQTLLFAGSGNYLDTLSNWPGQVSGEYYLLNNGYAAYLKQNNSGTAEPWIRDTTGKKTQLSYSNQSFSLDYLNPKGELIYWSDTLMGRTSAGLYNARGYRYLSTPNTGYFPICGQSGQTYYTDSTWYIAIGRTLFRVNFAVTPNKSDNFSVNVTPNSSYGFTAGTFIPHFEGGGNLSSVSFTRLPAHGTLTVQGGFQSINGNSHVVLQPAMSTLVYTPTAGFTGIDTVYWYGANGFTSSTDTAVLLLNVGSTLSLPPAPQINGLKTDYCHNTAAQQETVTNMPATGSGITVTSDLDGRAVTVTTGGLITIQPQLSSVGGHTLAVIFTNTAGADTTSTSFYVDSAVTPVVTLSANPSMVTGTTPQVVLTATDVSGGGTHPLYTLARDAGFMNIVQAESAANTVTVDGASLTVGSNVFYVRMRTSDSCYASQTGIDSIVLVVASIPAPAAPTIAGLDSVYCSNGGTVLFTMSNFPDTTGGETAVTDTLDNSPLAIGAGASCSIPLSGLSGGAHVVKVTYANTGGSSGLVATFAVVAASTPSVRMSASYTTMPDTAASVVARATGASGGSLPQYTFALNRDFAPVLYGPGTADSVVIDSAKLAVGANTVYVRMQSSDSCVTVQTAGDSVVIMRAAPDGSGPANDSTFSSIGVNPNPFRDRLVITGLVAADGYTISLFNSQGMQIGTVRVSGVTQTQLTPGPIPGTGIYMLRVYDETKGQVIRLVRLLGVGNN